MGLLYVLQNWQTSAMQHDWTAGAAVLHMSAFTSLCKRQPTILVQADAIQSANITLLGVPDWLQ
jgi:urease accessory protein UreF